MMRTRSLEWVLRVLVFLAATAVGRAQPMYQEGPPPQATQAFAEGKEAYDRGAYDDAVGLFGKAIRLAEEEYAEAYLTKGLAHMELDEFQQAIAALQKAIQQKEELDDDQQAEAYNGLGEAYLEFGPEGAGMALQNFMEAAQIGYKNTDYLLNLGSAFVKVRSPEQAVKILDKVIGLDDQLAKAYDARAQAHGMLAQLMPEEFELALTDFAKAIELDPDDKTFYYNLGLVLLRNERFDEAIAAFTKAIATDREQAARAQQSEMSNQGPPAETPAQNQAAETPAGEPSEQGPSGAVLPQAEVGDVPSSAGQPPAGEPPEDDEEGPYIVPLLARALTFIEIGKITTGETRAKAYGQAVADIDAVLALVPPQPDALLIRAVALRLMEDYQGAIAALTEALTINPEFSEALLRRGIVWYYLGEHGLALADLIQASQIAPDDARPHVWQGFAHASLGDYYEAVNAYGRALEQDKQFQPAFDNRGLAYLQLGQYDKAITDFNEVIRLDPANSEAYFKRGVAYDLMDDYDQSIGSYGSAVRIDPGHVAAYRRLAEACEKLGETDRARQARQQADEASRRAEEPGAERPSDRAAPKVPDGDVVAPGTELLPRPESDLFPGADAGQGLDSGQDQDLPSNSWLDETPTTELFPDLPSGDDSNALPELDLFP